MFANYKYNKRQKYLEIYNSINEHEWLDLIKVIDKSIKRKYDPTLIYLISDLSDTCNFLKINNLTSKKHYSRTTRILNYPTPLYLVEFPM